MTDSLAQLACLLAFGFALRLHVIPRVAAPDLDGPALIKPLCNPVPTTTNIARLPQTTDEESLPCAEGIRHGRRSGPSNVANASNRASISWGPGLRLGVERPGQWRSDHHQAPCPTRDTPQNGKSW